MKRPMTPLATTMHMLYSATPAFSEPMRKLRMHQDQPGAADAEAQVEPEPPLDLAPALHEAQVLAHRIGEQHQHHRAARHADPVAGVVAGLEQLQLGDLPGRGDQAGQQQVQQQVALAGVVACAAAWLRFGLGLRRRTWLDMRAGSGLGVPWAGRSRGLAFAALGGLSTVRCGSEAMVINVVNGVWRQRSCARPKQPAFAVEHVPRRLAPGAAWSGACAGRSILQARPSRRLNRC